jgi:hypothetical protein
MSRLVCSAAAASSEADAPTATEGNAAKAKPNVTMHALKAPIEGIPSPILRFEEFKHREPAPAPDLSRGAETFHLTGVFGLPAPPGEGAKSVVS